MNRDRHLGRVRLWLGVFITGLVLSGLTAFPLEAELRGLDAVLKVGPIRPLALSIHLLPWIDRVNTALAETGRHYPFLAYGTDWLAFAHLVIAVAFLGPYLDPVRNRWVITWGLIACAGVIPLAMIAGPARGIPLGWRLIDSSFGILGSIPLLIARRSILVLEREQGSRPPPAALP